MGHVGTGARIVVLAFLVAGCGGSSGGGGGGGAPVWLGALLAENDETAGATNVRLAVGPGGHAVVSWSAFHGAGLTDVFVNHYDPASGWQGEFAVATDIPSATFPAMRLAIDGAGNAVGVWGERQVALPGPPSTFFATTYDAATGTWSAPVAMESDDTGTADAVDVAAGPGGSFWVLFGLNMGSTMEVHVNRYTPAGGWSGPTLLDSADWDPSDSFLSAVHLAVDASGNAVAAWSRHTDTDSSGTITGADAESALARRYDAGSMAWGPLQTLNTSTADDAFVSAVRADPTGGFLFVWAQYDAAFDLRGYGQFFRSGVLEPPDVLWDHGDDLFPRDAGVDAQGDAVVVAGAAGIIRAFRYVAGGWSPPVTLQSDPLDDSFLEGFSMNAAGDAFVLWRQGASGDRDAYVRVFHPAVGFWLPEVNVDAPDSGNVRGGANVLADPFGNAMATWFADNGTDESFYAASYRHALGWSDPQDIDAGPQDVESVGTAAIGVDGFGRFMAAWSQGAPDDEDVYFNRTP